MGKSKKSSHEKSSYPQKINKVFCAELKKQKVKEIEMGIIGVAELSRSLEVSRSAIYKWIRKYSLTYQKPTRVIVESKSETKRIELLKKELKEAHEIIGQKQIQVEFYEKMIELINEEVGYDVKKKYGIKQSIGSGKIKQ